MVTQYNECQLRRRCHGSYSRGPTFTSAWRRHLGKVLHELRPKSQTEGRLVKVVVSGLGTRALAWWNSLPKAWRWKRACYIRAVSLTGVQLPWGFMKSARGLWHGQLGVNFKILCFQMCSFLKLICSKNTLQYRACPSHLHLYNHSSTTLWKKYIFCSPLLNTTKAQCQG